MLSKTASQILNAGKKAKGIARIFSHITYTKTGIKDAFHTFPVSAFGRPRDKQELIAAMVAAGDRLIDVKMAKTDDNSKTQFVWQSSSPQCVALACFYSLLSGYGKPENVSETDYATYLAEFEASPDTKIVGRAERSTQLEAALETT